MNAGESLSTPAQLVPPLFVPSFRARVHARTPASTFLFLFQPLDVTSRRREDGDGLEENPFFRGRCTHMVANEQMGWDRRHRIYCVTSYPLPAGEDHALVILLAPSRFTLAHFHHRLSSKPSTSNPGQTSVDRMSFHLLPSPILTSRHHFAAMDHLHHFVFPSVGTQVFQKNAKNVKILSRYYWIKDYFLQFYKKKKKKLWLYIIWFYRRRGRALYNFFLDLNDVCIFYKLLNLSSFSAIKLYN